MDESIYVFELESKNQEKSKDTFISLGSEPKEFVASYFESN